MTNKAYIVANEQQEREVLEKLEELGAEWNNGSVPTEYTLDTRKSLKILNQSVYDKYLEFPYVIYSNDDKHLAWDRLVDLDSSKVIVFDGRKEEHMSEKYVVSQEFMNELKEWKAGLNINGRYYIYEDDIFDLPSVIEDWWKDDTHALEPNNRLIAIIRWVNGEDVFEVEKPKKWVVRSKETDSEGSHLYVNLSKGIAIPDITTYFGLESATRFDTKEEAESWANAHQEVVEVVDV